MKMLVLHPYLHLLHRVADIGGIQLPNQSRIWIVALDRNHGHATLSIVLVELLNAALIHLRNWAMIARENYNKNLARSVVAQLVNLAVHARQHKVWRGRSDSQNGVRLLPIDRQRHHPSQRQQQ